MTSLSHSTMFSSFSLSALVSRMSRRVRCAWRLRDIVLCMEATQEFRRNSIKGQCKKKNPTPHPKIIILIVKIIQISICKLKQEVTGKHQTTIFTKDVRWRKKSRNICSTQESSKQLTAPPIGTNPTKSSRSESATLRMRSTSNKSSSKLTVSWKCCATNVFRSYTLMSGNSK